MFAIFLILLLLSYIIFYMTQSPLIYIILILISIVHPLISFFYGDKIVLRMVGAKEADPIKDVYIHNVVEGMVLAAGLPAKPKVYIIDDPTPNAFATGRDPKHASIALTSGIIQLLNRQELEAVIAHEMSHIKNYDSLFMTVTVVLIGIISLMAQMILRTKMIFGGNQRERKSSTTGILAILIILAALLSPIIARLIALAISRKREYLADSTAAQLTRNPAALASALEKVKNAPKTENDYGVARALFFSDPEKYDSQPKLDEQIANLFSTHPPIDERIKILRSM
jgi:heat shock protein HtpX